MICTEAVQFLSLQCKSIIILIALFFYEPSDLLTIDPHSPTPEPVSYDKTDGLWYTHDGVDVKDSQQRKGKKALKVIDSNAFRAWFFLYKFEHNWCRHSTLPN